MGSEEPKAWYRREREGKRSTWTLSKSETMVFIVFDEQVSCSNYGVARLMFSDACVRPKSPASHVWCCYFFKGKARKRGISRGANNLSNLAFIPSCASHPYPSPAALKKVHLWLYQAAAGKKQDGDGISSHLLEYFKFHTWKFNGLILYRMPT